MIVFQLDHETPIKRQRAVHGRVVRIRTSINVKGHGLITVNGTESLITSSPHPNKQRGRKRGKYLVLFVILKFIRMMLVIFNLENYCYLTSK